MKSEKYFIEFENEDLGKSNVLARELSSLIKEEYNDAILDIEKKDETNQDLGSILSIVLYAPVAVALVSVVKNYLKVKNNISIKVTNENKTFSATGINSKTADKLFEKILNTFKNDD